MVTVMQLVAETEKRYEARQREREESKSLVAEGALVEANSQERVDRRLARFARTPAGAEMRATEAASPQGFAALALERIMGKNDLLSITYLERAMSVARSVARVRVRGANSRTVGFGTGFMVSPRLLLTNDHVLHDEGEATFAQAEFNFQDRLDGTPNASHVFDLDPKAFFLTDVPLDYTLVAVNPHGRDNGDLASFGWNRLIEEEGKAIKGECLNIIQHPNGEPKQIALRENKLVDILEQFLHYETDTVPGSSGSPVFNDQWEVVALHHSGVPHRDDAGRILTRDGTLWTEAMGEQHVDWVSNEGARVSRIVKNMRSRRLTGEKARLRDEVFAAQPTDPVPFIGGLPPEGNTMSEQPTKGTDRTQRGTRQEPPVTGDGTGMTWTIPLHINVRFGTPTMATDAASIRVAPGNDGRDDRHDDRRSASDDDAAMDSTEVREALAELEAARRAPYYDAAGDGQAREVYYRAVTDATDADNEGDLYRPLRDLLKRAHHAAELQTEPPRLPRGGLAAQRQVARHLLRAGVRAGRVHPRGLRH